MAPRRHGTSKIRYLEDTVPRRHCTPKGREASEKLFETKTLVLVFKVDFNPKPRFGVEKLRTIKTARFCGRVLFGCESIRFASEKLLNDKIFIFWRSGVIWIPPPREGGI
jgi:hypothetical protein